MTGLVTECRQRRAAATAAFQQSGRGQRLRNKALPDPFRALSL